MDVIRFLTSSRFHRVDTAGVEAAGAQVVGTTRSGPIASPWR